MLKKEINFISDLNINKIQILGDKFSISDLSKSEIHPALLKYISSSIDYEIFRDKKRMESNSIFNYNSDRIINYFNLISQEVKRTQNFDFDYIKKILQNAVIFNINYLSKPNSTLVKSIFGDSTIKSIEEIVLKLGGLYYYRYLQKILLTYLDKKQVILMKKEEFIELLEKIDTISKETHLDNTLSTVVNSMGNFFDPASKTAPKIPLVLIQQYLDEKNLSEYSAKLFENFGDDPALAIASGDLINALKTVTPETEISIEQESELDNNFIEDNSLQEETAETLEPVETELIAVDDNLGPVENDIFTADEEHEEIPNSEILSSDHSKISDQEVLDENENALESEEEKNDDEIENKSDSSQAEDQKKKIEITSLIDSLINVNDLYKSLHSESNPFSNTNLKEKIIEFLSSDNSAELNYKLDLSTLPDVISGNTPHKVEVFENSNDEQFSNFDKLELSDKDDEIDIDSSTKELESNFDNLELLENSESIDLMIEQNEAIAIDDVEEIEESNSEIIDDSKLVLSDDDEELTEVFTDLIYLSEESKEEIAELKISQEELNETSETPELNENFEEIIVAKDMTKIIENVFDYDMEDYHNLINKISSSANELDALKIIEDYCYTNHIETNSDEVEELKSIISEFFTQTYS